MIWNISLCPVFMSALAVWPVAEEAETRRLNGSESLLGSNLENVFNGSQLLLASEIRLFKGGGPPPDVSYCLISQYST